MKALTLPCAEEFIVGFLCAGSRPNRHMKTKPFIQMQPADKVEWRKPKTSEKPRLGEVFKKIIVKKNPRGDQITAKSPQREVRQVKDQ